MINSRPIIDESFESWLENRCFEENPTVLDDDMPDFFSAWLGELDTEELIEYGNEFGRELLELLDKANQHESPDHQLD